MGGADLSLLEAHRHSDEVACVCVGNVVGAGEPEVRGGLRSACGYRVSEGVGAFKGPRGEPRRLRACTACIPRETGAVAMCYFVRCAAAAPKNVPTRPDQ